METTMPPIDDKTVAAPAAPEVIAEPAKEPTAEEADAALTAGYNKVKPPETPAEPDKKEPDAPDAPAAAAPAEPAKPAAPDPWEGVPPVVKTTLESITGKLGAVDTLAKEVKSGTGRIAAMQSQLATAQAAAKTVAVAPTPEQIASASKSKEKWDALKSDFPEWTDAMDERFAAEREATLKAIPKPEAVDVAAITRDVGAAVRTDAVTLARQLARVDAKHENWEADIQAPEFAAWVATQAPEVKALADSSNASDAIKMLDMYYDHRKGAERKDKNKARLDAAVTPKSASSGGPSILPDEAGLSVGYNRIKRA
jgi:hypothetical protein